MLVLLSFGLVLVATVLLVLGLLADDGLTLIYISIACSVLAGVVLVVATRLGRPKARAESSGPAPLSEPSAAPAAEPVPEPAAAGAASAPVSESLPRSEPATADTSFAPEPETTPLPPVETVPEEDEDEDFFPIADYDDLSVNEILPLLPELYADEIDVVEEKERSGKGRATILNRLAELREVLADAPPDTTAAQVIAERPRATKKKAAAKTAAKKSTAKKATGTRKKASSTTKKVVVEPTDETATRAPATKKTTKKATSKKAAPAKKATKAKRATKATKATKKA